MEGRAGTDVWEYLRQVVGALEPDGLGSNPSSKKVYNLSDLLSLHLSGGNNNTHARMHTQVVTRIK